MTNQESDGYVLASNLRHKCVQTIRRLGPSNIPFPLPLVTALKCTEEPISQDRQFGDRRSRASVIDFCFL